MQEIRDSLEVIRDRLNQYYRLVYPSLDSDLVVLSNYVDDDGQAYSGNRDKIIMFLASIEHETSVSTYHPNIPAENDTYDVVTAPIYINLYVLFTANFINRKNQDQNYTRGLGYISDLISYFQQTPVFNHDTAPGIPETIEKLAFQIYNLDILQLNHILGVTGSRYLPSVFYRARTIPFDARTPLRTANAVRGLSSPREPANPDPIVPRLHSESDEEPEES